MTRNQQRGHKRKKKATSPREASGHNVPRTASAGPTTETFRRTAETVSLIEQALESQPVVSADRHTCSLREYKLWAG